MEATLRQPTPTPEITADAPLAALTTIRVGGDELDKAAVVLPGIRELRVARR